MLIPTVHMNGTAGEVLRDQYAAAVEALRKAIDAVCDAGPNARDYYVQGPDAGLAAQREHDAIMASVTEDRPDDAMTPLERAYALQRQRGAFVTDEGVN
jgi:hypothetical protein